MTSTKNKIPTTRVALEIIFSGPLSFTLANRFNPPLPVKAPLIPSDFQLCNRERSIKITDTTINKISSSLILLSDLSLFYYNKGVVKLQTVPLNFRRKAGIPCASSLLFTRNKRFNPTASLLSLYLALIP